MRDLIGERRAPVSVEAPAGRAWHDAAARLRSAGSLAWLILSL